MSRVQGSRCSFSLTPVFYLFIRFSIFAALLVFWVGTPNMYIWPTSTMLRCWVIATTRTITTLPRIFRKLNDSPFPVILSEQFVIKSPRRPDFCSVSQSPTFLIPLTSRPFFHILFDIFKINFKSSFNICHSLPHLN